MHYIIDIIVIAVGGFMCNASKDSKDDPNIVSIIGIVLILGGFGAMFV